jgi:hypothetical protein
MAFGLAVCFNSASGVICTHCTAVIVRRRPDLTSLPFKPLAAAAHDLWRFARVGRYPVGEAHATVEAVPGANVVVAKLAVVHGVDTVTLGLTIGAAYLAHTTITINVIAVSFDDSLFRTLTTDTSSIRVVLETITANALACHGRVVVNGMQDAKRVGHVTTKAVGLTGVVNHVGLENFSLVLLHNYNVTDPCDLLSNLGHVAPAKFVHLEDLVVLIGTKVDKVLEDVQLIGSALLGVKFPDEFSEAAVKGHRVDGASLEIGPIKSPIRIINCKTRRPKDFGLDKRPQIRPIQISNIDLGIHAIVGEK